MTRFHLVLSLLVFVFMSLRKCSWSSKALLQVHTDIVMDHTYSRTLYVPHYREYVFVSMFSRENTIHVTKGQRGRLPSKIPLGCSHFASNVRFPLLTKERVMMGAVCDTGFIPSAFLFHSLECFERALCGILCTTN